MLCRAALEPADAPRKGGDDFCRSLDHATVKLTPFLICDTPLVDAVKLRSEQGILIALSNHTLQTLTSRCSPPRFTATQFRTASASHSNLLTGTRTLLSVTPFKTQGMPEPTTSLRGQGATIAYSRFDKGTWQVKHCNLR